MLKAKRFIVIILSLLISIGSVGNVFAQEQKSAGPSIPVVTATAKGRQVRFASLGEVQQIRIEVFDTLGLKVFDSSFMPGNLYDWRLTDQQGQPLSDGSFLFVVTIRDFSGQLSQKYGNITLQQQQVAVELVGRKHLPEAQAGALESSRQSNTQALADRVGVEVPAGESAATQSAPSSATTQNSNTIVAQPNATSASTLVANGAGTTNQLSKWTDGPNAILGDSAITEVDGKVGIGTTTPPHIFSVRRNLGTAGVHNLGELFVDRDNNTRSASMVLGTAGTLKWIFGMPAGNEGFQIYDLATNSSRLYVHPTTGNIGLGTTTPTHKFEVVGNIKLTGGTSKIVFADGTSLSSANPGGGTPSGNSLVGAINDPTTTTTIADNRLTANIARLNGANNWTGANVFSTGLSANGALITGVGNPVNAGDATNKAYTDANFVKFVPGAEQLSVGDANGTAPMINLRGGSTCCSGPGGHTPAWFKVFQNGSFVATGNLGIGTSPMQGKGYRTSWDSYKGAFRSGYADNEWDDASVGFFSWAGGSNSTAIGLYALAFGDTNQAESTSSIVFGSGNQVKGAAGFSAGAGNRVCDTYGVAFGNKAISGSPILADGRCDPDTFNIRGLAAVAIGYNVTASMDHTMALGKFASNNGFSGTFIWSDGSATASADTFRNTANNEFAARATGGFRFRTNLGGTTGCNLPAGSGVFNCTSSRYTKENFTFVNGNDVLARLRKVPVTTWNYISEGQQVRHMGPMAEDFYQAFGLGTGNTSIGVQDLAGVSMAAIKALEQRTAELQQKTSEVEQLRAEVSELKAQFATLQQSMQANTKTRKANHRR